MCDAGALVEVAQTLSCPMQLFVTSQRKSGGGCGTTYQLQSVDVVPPNIFHDISVEHPLRNSGKLPFIHVPLDPNEFQDVRMGQRIPEENFFAELLGRMVRTVFQAAGRISWTLTFLISRKSSRFATLMVFTATRHPWYVPVLTSANPPEASISSETPISSVIIIDSGNRPWVAASSLNMTEKVCLSAALSLCSARP